MKTKTKIKLSIAMFCIIVSIGGPLYQITDSVLKNTPGDGVETYGDNPIFRNILGIKKVHKYLEQGEGWIAYKTTIITPPWMQQLGISPEVERVYDEESIVSKDFYLVIFLRWLIKLLPVVLLFLIFRKRKKLKA